MNADQRNTLVSNYLTRTQPGYGFDSNDLRLRRTRIRYRIAIICKISICAALSFLLGYGLMAWMNT